MQDIPRDESPSTAQNGLVDQTKPLVHNQCGKKGKKKGPKGKPKKHRSS